MNEKGNWFAGVDWAKQSHVVSLIDGSGAKLGGRAFDHSGAGLAELAAWLSAQTKATPDAVCVAIEVPHGPVVESLMAHGFQVHSINPKQLDRFRDRFSPAGAKDDSRDAYVLADSLRTDPQCFRRLEPTDALTVELREWSRLNKSLTDQRVRLGNQLREQLWRYYPQMLDLVEDVSDGWFLELWALLPTPQDAKRVRGTTIARLLKQHRIRRLDATQVLECLRRPALAVAPGTTQATVAHVKILIKQLELINRQCKQAAHMLDGLLERLAQQGAAGSRQEHAAGQQEGQRDVIILRTLPGIGRTNLATLLADAPDALQQRNYHALRCLCGTAPVTKRSGKTIYVQRRLAAPRSLVNAAYHWGQAAVQHDPVSKAKYTALRKRGLGHARALRSVLDRLLAVACAMLKTQTEYDPNHARA
jgi:transposase